MRVYDVALVLIRSYAAIDLIHALIELPGTALRSLAIFSQSLSPAAATGFALDLWQAPLDLALLGVVLLVASKAIARFASNFAASADAASAF